MSIGHTSTQALQVVHANNSSLVMDLILSLAKTNNTVSIIATHNLEIIKRLDICYKIEKGKLIEI